VQVEEWGNFYGEEQMATLAKIQWQEVGLGRLSKYFGLLLIYSFILNALAYYSFTVTYYSHLGLQKK